MIAYNRAITKFEEVMRAERERRIDKNWSFCKYFCYQEELAQVFRYISLEEEALIQYDELDALFTQFILNSVAGDTPRWLLTFSQPCENWEGLCLKDGENEYLNEKIKEKNISLMEFRNYLFQRQCQLLVKLNKPWELANRALNFLHNTVTELRILNVNIYDGGMACWGFLSCLEIIYLLFKYKNSASTDSHALHCAPLWSFARDKLRELGIICGLMPNVKTSSEQIHIVINLVCGMGNDPHAEEMDEKNLQSPMTRMKEALSTKEAFMKHFLDISEIAISTYKHNGRIRSARHIGRDLARFYIQEGAFLKAIPFLSDQLKTFMEENWPLLIFSTQMELAKCFMEVDDKEKYVRACLSLSAMDVKQFKDKKKEYFQHALDTVNASSDQFLMSSDNIFSIDGFELVTTGPIISGKTIEVVTTLCSYLPSPLWCKKFEILLKHNPEKQEKNYKTTEDNDRKPSFARRISSRSSSDGTDLKNKSSDWDAEVFDENNDKNSYKQQIKMKIQLDYKQDKSLSAASVSCSNPHQVLRRRDSQSNVENLDKPPIKEVSADVLVCERFNLEPGINTIRLMGVANKSGLFTGGQVIISTENFQFICSKMLQRGVSCMFEVVNDSCRVYLSRRNSELLAGIPQNLTLTVNSGSTLIEKDTEMKVIATRGLLLRKLGSELPQSPVKIPPDDNCSFSREITVQLSRIEPFQRSDIPLVVLSELTVQKDSSMVEHMVSVTCHFLKDSRADIDIHFIRPFMVTYKLQTANLKKFIQITVTGFVSSPMYLFNPHLEFVNNGASPPLKILNDVTQTLAICRDYSASYIWELDVDYSVKETNMLKANFSVNYHTSSELPQSLEQKYQYSFDVHHYKSLHTIRAKVDPAKGFEFCRVGNMCHLHISIVQVEQEGGNYPESKSVMYEVIADQTMWAVCGQSSGVFMMDDDIKKSVMIEVMPLTSGFLPLPSVRLSKYIPAEAKPSKDKKSEFVGTPSSMPRLEPFNPGEIYNFNKASQIHILPASSTVQADIGAGL